MKKQSKQKRAKKNHVKRFPVINPNASGIDVSDKEMVVAFPPENDGSQLTETFESFTCDLHRISALLKEHGVTTVAMESTGVYWVHLFTLLQEEGFEVYLVNAKHVKNVTGRKNDESDAQWIQKLHSCGLLNNSFQPDEMTRTLRSLVRHRKMLVRSSSDYINRMQKSLELMNIKVHTVIRDILGKTGTAIIEAIIAGERDAEVLADMADPRIKATRETMVKSLEGHWRFEHIFCLTQAYENYLFHRQQIEKCDKEIENHLKTMAAKLANSNERAVEKEEKKTKIKRKRTTNKTKLQFNATFYLQKLSGVDVTEINGISEISALEIFSETGFDMSHWPGHKQFTSWLGFAPNNKISGGKLISSKIMKKKHPAGQAFRMAVISLFKSQTPLGDRLRRIKARSGPGVAIVATARSMAVCFYQMVRKQEAFNPSKLEIGQEKFRQYKIKRLEKQLAALKAA